MKKCFSLSEFYCLGNSYNREAASNYTNNKSQFDEKVAECIEHSIANIYNDYNGIFELKFSAFNTVHQCILEKLKTVSDDNKLTEEEQVDKFINWALNECD